MIEELAEGCEILSVSFETIQAAVTLREQYFFSFWDSLIIASAMLGNATILYSEDMQNGLIVNNNLEIINPFKVLN